MLRRGCRVQARPEQLEAGVAYRLPRLAQLAEDLLGAIADPGLELDLFAEDLG